MKRMQRTILCLTVLILSSSSVFAQKAGDLSVMSHLADTLYVMYSGQLIERGAAENVIRHPLHPYTTGLLKSRPQFSKERLTAMEGNPPTLTDRVPGTCQFRERCSYKKEACESFTHRIPEGNEEHFVSCALTEQA